MQITYPSSESSDKYIVEKTTRHHRNTILIKTFFVFPLHKLSLILTFAYEIINMLIYILLHKCVKCETILIIT